MANTELTESIITDNTGRKMLKKLDDIVVSPQVVDNLTTDDPNRPLSARQGKYINDHTVYTTNNSVGSVLKSNADMLNGHPDTYFGTATDVQANADAISSLSPQSKTISYTSRITTVYRSSCFLVGHLLCISFNVMASTGADAEFAELPYNIASDVAYDFSMNKANGNACNGYIVGKKMYFNSPIPSGEGLLCCICVPVTIS